MTGGAFKNSSNLLSRRREIEELEKTVQKLKQEMTETGRSVRSTRKKNVPGIMRKPMQIRTELQKAYVVQNTAKMNADQASDQDQKLQTAVGQLQE